MDAVTERIADRLDELAAQADYVAWATALCTPEAGFSTTWQWVAHIERHGGYVSDVRVPTPGPAEVQRWIAGMRELLRVHYAFPYVRETLPEVVRCAVCDLAGGPWPCCTVRLIADVLGVGES